MLGCTEDVGVNLLPAVLVAEVAVEVGERILAVVAGKVLIERAHEDDYDEADEENNHHERVEN